MRPDSSLTTCSKRRAALAALRLGAFALVLCAGAAAGARAQEPEREERLPGSGIRYPLGYDAETEGAVEGLVLRIEVPQRGPVMLHLESDGRPVTVFVSPAWYWEAAAGRPAAGDQVRVIGSKTIGADGEFYLVARELEPLGSGCRCVFRDEAGRPLWRGRMHGAQPGRCLPPGSRHPAGGR